VAVRRHGEAQVAVERLLLLWDELDELVGYGWHFATSLSHSVALRLRRTRRPLRNPATDQA
jgi:hypothetical protein